LNEPNPDQGPTFLRRPALGPALPRPGRSEGKAAGRQPCPDAAAAYPAGPGPGPSATAGGAATVEDTPRRSDGPVGQTGLLFSACQPGWLLGRAAADLADRAGG